MASRTQVTDTVGLWVDDHGRAASAPASAGEITLNAAGARAGVRAAVAVCAGAAVFVRLRRVEAVPLPPTVRQVLAIDPVLWRAGRTPSLRPVPARPCAGPCGAAAGPFAPGAPA
ncbi:hypothetical protein [Streptomyces sp. NPDC096339]|uniref:hypothetical protein n=1 Tax=Streptomyces sp. NPDC096339 TaxID=3366086 RepID=UPI0038277F48